MSKRKRLLEEKQQRKRRQEERKRQQWDAAEKLSTHRSSIHNTQLRHPLSTTSSSSRALDGDSSKIARIESTSFATGTFDETRPALVSSLRRPRIICIPDDSVGSELDVDVAFAHSGEVRGGTGARSFGSFRTRRYGGTEESDESDEDGADAHIDDEKMTKRFARYVGGRNTRKGGQRGKRPKQKSRRGL